MQTNLSMKKLYTLLGATLLTASANVYAQQLPNAGFEDAWNISVPWTSAGNTTEMGAGPNSFMNGTKAYNPASWCISHVIGISISPAGGMGATVVGNEAEGYNSEKSVYIQNSPNAVLSTQTVPGYLTLGKTWSTSVFGQENDGGTFGGVDFNYRPDALSFYYKRSSTENEAATIVAYLWKGTYIQENVPGNISANTDNIITVPMTDRDRNILGMATDKGGDITSEGTRIATINTNIADNASEWTNFISEFQYESDEIPEKINVIISAGDYFGGATAVKQGTTLTVDDVKLVYYSRLNSAKINGAEVPNFDKNTFAYTVNSVCPDNESAFELEVLGKSATKEIAIDKANNVATVKVSNIDADSDGLKEHTYTFTFANAEQSAIKYVGTLVVNFGAETTIPNSELYITPNSANTCTMAIYDFAFMGATVGDIIVDNISTTTGADGNISYSGSKEGLQLSLGGSPLVANVNVTGTETPAGALTMNIAVNVPGLGDIPVTFNGQKSTSSIDTIVDDENAPVEYYNLNGIRVDSENLTPGIYVKRQGHKATKILIRK